jgi:hypothetical protein
MYDRKTYLSINITNQNAYLFLILNNIYIYIYMSGQNNIVNGHLEIKEGTTRIEDYAFANNKLTSVRIPDSVTSIEKNAFLENKLTSVRIPDSVTSIGGGAFLRNELLGSLRIPDSVTSIGGGAFGDNKLTSVRIPDLVTRIDGAFAGNELTSVEIPDSVTSIEEFAFASNQLQSVEIPYSVTSIGSNAFSDNKLTSVTIGNEVTSIGEQAFDNNKLTHVTIGTKVTSIGREAFYRNALTSVQIPESVTSIGDKAFTNNQLINVTMPAKFHNDEDKARIFGPGFEAISFFESKDYDGLFKALGRNRIDDIRSQLDLGININHVSTFTGDTALLRAVKGTRNTPYEDTVEELIRRNPKLDLLDSNGKTALMLSFENSYDSRITPLLIRTIVETEREQRYRSRIASLDANFYRFLNTSRPVFTNQLRTYINSNHNYLSDIKKFVVQHGVKDSQGNFLIVDFDNLAYNTIKSPLQTLETEGRRIDGRLKPNVDSHEMIEYKSAALAVLRYARENGFNNIIVVVKNVELEEQFKTAYKYLKLQGKLEIKQKKNGIKIAADFYDNELQSFLQLSTTNVSLVRINSRIDSIIVDETELARYSLSRADFTNHLHKLKGTDDSIIILISNTIRRKYGVIPTVISADTSIVEDFIANHQYICPFLTTIEVNGTRFSEFVVNFTERVSDLIHRDIIEDRSGTYFIRVDPSAERFLMDYYYKVSQPSGTGFNVRNWYTRPTGTSDIKATFNTTAPSDTSTLVDYMDAEKKPKLNPSGKPYLSQNGEIAKLEHTNIPYVIENYRFGNYTYTPAARVTHEPYRDIHGKILSIKIGNDSSKKSFTPYCIQGPAGEWIAAKNGDQIYTSNYNGKNNPLQIFTEGNLVKTGRIAYVDEGDKPVLKKKIEPYRDAKGNIDKIKIFDEQPYAKKYVSTNNSSGEHLEYYQKYMKYKVKYNELKKKLGL